MVPMASAETDVRKQVRHLREGRQDPWHGNRLDAEGARARERHDGRSYSRSGWSSDTPSPPAYSEFNCLGLLTTLQYLTSTLGVWVLGKLDVLYHDPFTLDNTKKFLPAALVFYLVIFTNTNLLRHANVDTFIVFCSLTPLLVAIADTIFRSKPCPSKLAFLSLLIILSGAVSYVAIDSAFSLTAYSWEVAYLVTRGRNRPDQTCIVKNRPEPGLWPVISYFFCLSLACGLFIKHAKT
ncbi:GDP-fucose transporter 1 [Canna indica]|uniref:GDP-fucose transporter 1 n=1 Tax=Canna indica TaxID=4628 RepID=A0AAQ3KR17_9LILI|nr:GDP-fucose transporter 1 [Canna indica]